MTTSPPIYTDIWQKFDVTQAWLDWNSEEVS
jgi:hypothetical protein